MPTRMLRAMANSLSTRKFRFQFTVHSGDTVRVQTLSTCGSNDRLEEEGVAAADIPSYNADIYREVKDKGPGGHILTGPVAIAEAEPGDVLEIQILKIDIDTSWACNGFAAGRGFLPNDYPYGRSKIIPLDREKMLAKFAPALKVWRPMVFVKSPPYSQMSDTWVSSVWAAPCALGFGFPM